MSCLDPHNYFSVDEIFKFNSHIIADQKNREKTKDKDVKYETLEHHSICKNCYTKLSPDLVALYDVNYNNPSNSRKKVDWKQIKQHLITYLTITQPTLSGIDLLKSTRLEMFRYKVEIQTTNLTYEKIKTTFGPKTNMIYQSKRNFALIAFLLGFAISSFYLYSSIKIAGYTIIPNTVPKGIDGVPGFYWQIALLIPLMMSVLAWIYLNHSFRKIQHTLNSIGLTVQRPVVPSSASPSKNSKQKSQNCPFCGESLWAGIDFCMNCKKNIPP